MSKIMRVYYDNAGLPYKDSALSTLYPIVGSEFTGANNTTDIHFYTDNMGQALWVANCKLPNGDKVNRLLVQGIDEDGNSYYSLPLDRELTSIQGHLKIGLNGYAGNISIDEEELEENDLVVISGTPTIIATGVIDIAMNYSPIVIPVSDLTPSDYQQLLAIIGSKLDITKGIFVLEDITNADYTNYALGQIIYDKNSKLFYRVVSNGFVLENIDIGSLEVNGQTLSSLLAGIVYEEELQNYYTKTEVNGLLDNKVDKLTTSGQYAYVHLGSTQGELPIATPATGDTIAKRESDGRLKVSTPEQSGDATTKDYVDTEVQGAKTYAKDYADNLFTSALVYKGTKTVAELNALTGQKVGDFYNVSDSGILTAGNIEVIAGDNVAWTGSSWDKLTMDLSAYDDKFIAAGFFEVQDYNENEGTITFVYASDLYDMSYSETTGILTIEAN